MKKRIAGSKEVLAWVTVHTTRRQLRGFLGMAGFCHISIPNFGLVARHLYEALKGNDIEPLSWAAACHKVFHTIRIIEEVYSHTSDLTDQPLEYTVKDTFMDGSSFMDHRL